MGFINVNGQQVHTSNISTGTNSVYGGSGTLSVTGSSVTGSSGNNIFTVSGTGSYITTSTNTFTTYSMKAKYFILGEEFEIDGYQDPMIGLIISSINTMGKPFYDDLKKQSVNLPDEIVEFLEHRFIILERDKKIDDIITH